MLGHAGSRGRTNFSGEKSQEDLCVDSPKFILGRLEFKNFFLLSSLATGYGTGGLGGIAG